MVPLAQKAVRGHPLAVVGGGSSAARHLDVLRQWPGEIWAINYTQPWLTAQGIESILFSVEAQPMKIDAERALLASCCHPETFASVAKAEKFHSAGSHDGDGVIGSVTTATRAPMLALSLGYTEVHFFGCEGSYEDADHVDRHDGRPDAMVVRSRGRDFKTYPELLLQTEWLAGMVAHFPDMFKDRSGGLLGSFDPDGYEVVAVCPSLKRSLIEQNGDSGLYEGAYQWQPS